MLETTGDTQQLSELKSSDSKIPCFLIFLNQYVEIIEHHRVYDIFVGDEFGNVKEYLKYNEKQIQNSRDNINALMW